MKIIIKHSFVLVILFECLNSCNFKERIKKQGESKDNADFIMSNLHKTEIVEQFPEKYFPRQTIKYFLDTLSKNCDLISKRGKYIDFFTINNNGKFYTSHIYEYFLDCDSLRFIYTFDLSTTKPELMNLKVEGIEQANDMLINPEKSLLNSPPLVQGVPRSKALNI